MFTSSLMAERKATGALSMSKAARHPVKVIFVLIPVVLSVYNRI